MNRWKIAFWVLLFLFLTTLYLLIDTQIKNALLMVNLSTKRSNATADFDIISKYLSRSTVADSNAIYNDASPTSDTLLLENINLLFSNDHLIGVLKK